MNERPGCLIRLDPGIGDAVKYGMTFASKVDFWIFPGMPMFAGILSFVVVGSLSGAVAGVCTGVVVFLITLLIFRLTGFPCEYTFAEDALLIRCGPMRAKIPYAHITSVRPTRMIWSAPAWSLDRLRVDLQDGPWSRMAVVSPKDKARFVAELDARVKAARVG